MSSGEKCQPVLVWLPVKLCSHLWRHHGHFNISCLLFSNLQVSERFPHCFDSHLQNIWRDLTSPHTSILTNTRISEAIWGSGGYRYIKGFGDSIPSKSLRRRLESPCHSQPGESHSQWESVNSFRACCLSLCLFCSQRTLVKGGLQFNKNIPERFCKTGRPPFFVNASYHTGHWNVIFESFKIQW